MGINESWEDDIVGETVINLVRVAPEPRLHSFKRAHRNNFPIGDGNRVRPVVGPDPLCEAAWL